LEKRSLFIDSVVYKKEYSQTAINNQLYPKNERFVKKSFKIRAKSKSTHARIVSHEKRVLLGNGRLVGALVSGSGVDGDIDLACDHAENSWQIAFRRVNDITLRHRRYGKLRVTHIKHLNKGDGTSLFPSRGMIFREFLLIFSFKRVMLRLYRFYTHPI